MSDKRPPTVSTGVAAAVLSSAVLVACAAGMGIVVLYHSCG